MPKKTDVRTPKTPYSVADPAAAAQPVAGGGEPSAQAVVDDFETLAVAGADAAVQLVEAGAALQPAAAPNTNLTTELNNIDFRKMISGPLQAAVDAQVASSLATIDFIQRVGFTQNGNGGGSPELVMVDFSHKRSDVNDQGQPVEKTTNIKVPLLAMLPIPSLRIEHVMINFNAKLNSVETSNVSDKLGIEASAQGGWGPVSFKVSASYQRQTSSGVEVKKEYSIGVNVKAVQDEMPAGLEKILGMLAA